ncbi:hypothetical protein Tco_1197399 [Tanacetum coccineum]
MEFTSNNRAVAGARLVSMDEELLANEERYHEQSKQLARLVLWHEYLCTNGVFSLENDVEQSTKISEPYLSKATLNLMMMIEFHSSLSQKEFSEHEEESQHSLNVLGDSLGITLNVNPVHLEKYVFTDFLPELNNDGRPHSVI